MSGESGPDRSLGDAFPSPSLRKRSSSRQDSELDCRRSLRTKGDLRRPDLKQWFDTALENVSPVQPTEKLEHRRHSGTCSRITHGERGLFLWQICGGDHGLFSWVDAWPPLALPISRKIFTSHSGGVASKAPRPEKPTVCSAMTWAFKPERLCTAGARPGRHFRRPDYQAISATAWV